MEILVMRDGSYNIPGFGPVRPDADGEAGQRLAAILSDPSTTVIPFVPPPPPTAQERRAAKYVARVDEWTHAIKRYEVRLLDARLTQQQKDKIQVKLDAAILKVQDESTLIEQEDADPE